MQIWASGEVAMSDSAHPTGLQQALTEIASWREESEGRLAARLEAIDLEEQRLREAVSELEKELEGLEALRAKLRTESAELDSAQLEKAHHAMLAGLAADRDMLAGRAADLASARAGAADALKNELDDPEVIELIAEYERFSEAEATLDALPESYRHAILTHHETVKSRLQPLFERIRAAGPSLEVAPAAVSIVASLEFGAAGNPESLTFVLPIDSAVYSDWSDREEDLSTRLGYRVVAMAARLAKTLGVAGAPLNCHDHEGFLSVHLWLGDWALSGDAAEATEAATAGSARAATAGSATAEAPRAATDVEHRRDTLE